MSRNIVQVLDLGSQNIKAIVAERSSSDNSFRILGVSMVPSAGIRRGVVSSREQLIPKIKEAIKEAERASGIPMKHVYVSFGAPGLNFLKSRGRIAISRADGEVATHDVDRVIRQAQPSSSLLANKEILETFGLNFSVDSELILKDPVGIKGENLETEAIFLTALRQPLRESIGAVEAAGLAVDDVIPEPLAINRALLSDREREVGAAVVDFGAEAMSIGVFEEGLPFSVASFPFGGAHITNDIALGFQVSLPEAERIKIAGVPPEDSNAAKKRFNDIVEARLEDMFELIEGHLKKNGRSGLLPGGIVFTGGGAKVPGLCDFAKNALRLPASGGKCAALDDGHKINDPMWASAIGLCLIALDEEKSASSSFRRPSFLKQKIFSWFKSMIP